MDSSTDQRLKETFAEAMRRPERPALTPGVEHGPTASRRPDRSSFLLRLDRIRPDPDQVRTQNKGADDEEVKELAASIREVGIENPLLIRYLRDEDIYELIAGERRYAAATLAGLEEVPVKLIDADAKTVRRLQLHENVHRANLTPMELGHALQQLVSDGETPESWRLSCARARPTSRRP
jgi:ParB family chromosome partitioning protein